MANSRRIEPMLTTSDVARLLNVHINTVRRWSNQGTLKTYRIGARGDRRFRREDIVSFLSPEASPAGGNGDSTSTEKPSPLNGNKVLANY
jgi:excisionase family DNA binding protein